MGEDDVRGVLVATVFFNQLLTTWPKVAMFNHFWWVAKKVVIQP